MEAKHDLVEMEVSSLIERTRVFFKIEAIFELSPKNKLEFDNKREEGKKKKRILNKGKTVYKDLEI